MSKNTNKSLNMLKKLILLPGKIISCFKLDDEKYIIIPTPQSSASNLNFIDANDLITAPTPQNSAVNIKFAEDEISKIMNMASQKLANQKK